MKLLDVEDSPKFQRSLADGVEAAGVPSAEGSVWKREASEGSRHVLAAQAR